jgi:hypothetical protein
LTEMLQYYRIWWKIYNSNEKYEGIILNLQQNHPDSELCHPRPLRRAETRL